jgi:hypothetical protein
MPVRLRAASTSGDIKRTMGEPSVSFGHFLVLGALTVKNCIFRKTMASPILARESPPHGRAQRCKDMAHGRQDMTGFADSWACAFEVRQRPNTPSSLPSARGLLVGADRILG